MAQTQPLTLDDLGIQGCVALGALLAAQEKRLPVAPTRRMTLSLMHSLRELEIISAPWPDPKWVFEPTAEETPIEQVQWRYTWANYLRAGLSAAIEDYLMETPRDDWGLACRARLWNDLAVAEAERYFETQLARHHFETSWAQDLIFVIRESRFTMPIAQWRYCCWAAVRHGGSLAQQQRGMDPQSLREAIYTELKRRAPRVANGDWANCIFAPFNPVPESAASRLFVQHLTGLGPAFWLLPPSLDGLLAMRNDRRVQA
jgi:hypothetical protein